MSHPRVGSITPILGGHGHDWIAKAGDHRSGHPPLEHVSGNAQHRASHETSVVVPSTMPRVVATRMPRHATGSWVPAYRSAPHEIN